MNCSDHVDEATLKHYGRGSYHFKDIDMNRVDEQNYDVTLLFGSQTKKVHKYVSASVSLFFKRIFTHPMIENISGVATISGIDKNIVQSFIKLAYTGKLNGDRNNLLSVLLAADFLQNDKLKCFC